MCTTDLTTPKAGSGTSGLLAGWFCRGFGPLIVEALGHPVRGFPYVEPYNIKVGFPSRKAEFRWGGPHHRPAPVPLGKILSPFSAIGVSHGPL